jgi:hypothetical protein
MLLLLLCEEREARRRGVLLETEVLEEKRLVFHVHPYELKHTSFNNTWFYLKLHECYEFFVQVRVINMFTGVRRRFDIRHGS